MAAVDHDDPVALAAAFLRAVRTGGATRELRRTLADFDDVVLARRLGSDALRTAFWLDVYNGYAQYLLESDPDLWQKRRLPPTRPIFTDELFTVAGHELSLDDVEHGILRGSRSGVGLGYLPRVRVDGFERRHRVDEPDPRIHFALNCGAASCPPVAVYTRDGVDDELDSATASYLGTECSYDAGATVVCVPKLFSWYRGDFGGKSGVVRFLKRYGVVPEDASPSLAYADYDWSMKLGEFVELEA
ncbi:DUF547 domain-containing protein [Haloarchaeobius salinus]|uniref:DUF547 domain-containing protein n=1 Tax=Haloarchaeobius salinus TaxID=1198298 RepID=UPI00210E112E|nr:DUF547 domain-containing protein [Haloarchaeobius salinus]